MSKNKGYPTKYKIVRDLSYAAEIFYRMGVKHAAELGDDEEVERLLHVDDDYSHGQLPGEVAYDIYSLKFYRIFCDEVIVILNKSRCLQLTWFLRSEFEELALKRSMLSLLIYQYRKGLKHGLKVDLDRAREFWDECNDGRDHHFLFSDASYKQLIYLDTIKHRCNKIYSIRKRGAEEIDKPTRSTLILSKFIGDAIYEYKTGSKKYI